MKKRIIGATLITVVCALLISNLVGVLLFRSREMDAARNTLQELLVLMDAQSAITDPDGLAQQFHAAAPDKRLTIIDTDGTVLADTEANPQTLEDHNSRPEVEQAAATGWGEAVRHSETLGTSMFYVSKRFADGMVGRASMPLSSIDSLVWNGVWGFLIASAAGLLLALILARRTANRVVAPLSAVGSALQSVLDGTRASGLEEYQADDELRPILRYIDKLMERLGGYIQSITAERDKVGLILDCMDEGLILLDEAGNVLAINRAARTLFGFPDGEEDDGALLLPRSRRLREAIQESRVRHSSVVLDVDALTEDAQSLRLFISPVSGRQYEGQAVGTSILISDVTELKKAEGIRSEFTANVSHELKTPMTTIAGFSDGILDGTIPPDKERAALQTISSETRRLSRLVRRMLDLSRLQSAENVTAQEQFDVSEVMLRVLVSLENKINARHLDVDTQLPDGPVLVWGDPDAITQVCYNLLDNAIKFSAEGSTMGLSITAKGGKAHVAVRNHGDTIPPDELAMIFDRFHKSDKSRSVDREGVGLGLYIVKTILNNHKENISVTSQDGVTEFVFTLTLA